ncbi:MAG: hypothetical protein MI802_00945 [Desulfobacterales bacterium]|nr:hypothetical protein [Desulfobacterales bacterium]
MLYEIKNISKSEEGLKRRWFFDTTMDLLIWLDASDQVVGIQLCYDKEKSSRALTWFQKEGYRHNKVDLGDEKRGRRGGSPILGSDDLFDASTIAGQFKRLGANIDSEIYEITYEKLLAYNTDA